MKSMFLLRYMFMCGLLFSCGGRDHDYTARGFLVYLNGHPASKYHHERIIDKTIDLMSEVAPGEYPADALYTALDEWDGAHFISWHSDVFNCSGAKSGKCYGTHLLGDINVMYQPCLARSVLTHELVHFFNFAVQQTSDGKHLDKRFFAEGCMVFTTDAEKSACLWETVEWRSSYELAKEICPTEETYVRIKRPGAEALAQEEID